MQRFSTVGVRLLRYAILAGVVGCSAGDSPTMDPRAGGRSISGRVTVGGKPAAGVEVRLHLLNRMNDPSTPSPEGKTDSDGRYQLRTGDAEGAPNGQYLATLVWPDARGAGDRFGGAFAEPEGSGLTAVVEEGTTELPPFDVNAAAGSKRGRP